MPLLDRLGQAVEHPANLLRPLKQPLRVCRMYIAKLFANQQLRFQLHQRAMRNVQEPQKLFPGAPAVALGDVRRHRHSRPPDLGSRPYISWLGQLCVAWYTSLTSCIASCHTCKSRYALTAMRLVYHIPHGYTMRTSYNLPLTTYHCPFHTLKPSPHRPCAKQPIKETPQ